MYSVIYYNKSGGQTTLRFASSFSLYYGKKLVISRAFTKLQTSSHSKLNATRKEKLVQRYVNEHNKKHRAYLAKRREQSKLKAKIKRTTQRKEVDLDDEFIIHILDELLENELLKQAAKPAIPIEPEYIEPLEEEPPVQAKPPKDMPERMKASYAFMDNENYEFGIATSEVPKVFPNATVDDILVIPILPKNELYSKKLIEKKLLRNNGANIDYLSILSLDLNSPTIMNLDNFRESAQEVYEIFLPQLIEFFMEIKDVRNWFILRFKFKHSLEGQVISQGVSLGRHRIQDPNTFINFVRESISLFKGSIVDGRQHVRNYLLGNQDIFITGFTLEAGDIETTGFSRS